MNGKTDENLQISPDEWAEMHARLAMERAAAPDEDRCVFVPDEAFRQLAIANGIPEEWVRVAGPAPKPRRMRSIKLSLTEDQRLIPLAWLRGPDPARETMDPGEGGMVLSDGFVIPNPDTGNFEAMLGFARRAAGYGDHLTNALGARLQIRADMAAGVLAPATWASYHDTWIRWGA